LCRLLTEFFSIFDRAAERGIVDYRDIDEIRATIERQIEASQLQPRVVVSQSDVSGVVSACMSPRPSFDELGHSSDEQSDIETAIDGDSKLGATCIEAVSEDHVVAVPSSVDSQLRYERAQHMLWRQAIERERSKPQQAAPVVSTLPSPPDQNGGVTLNVGDREELHRKLRALNAMGFADVDANLIALRECGGGLREARQFLKNQRRGVLVGERNHQRTSSTKRDAIPRRHETENVRHPNKSRTKKSRSKRKRRRRLRSKQAPASLDEKGHQDAKNPPGPSDITNGTPSVQRRKNVSTTVGYSDTTHSSHVEPDLTSGKDLLVARQTTITSAAKAICVTAPNDEYMSQQSVDHPVLDRQNDSAMMTATKTGRMELRRARYDGCRPIREVFEEQVAPFLDSRQLHGPRR